MRSDRVTDPISTTRPAPLKQPNFRRLFAAALISLVGTQLSHLAIPIIAVAMLDAGAGEVGLLGMLSTVAFLVIGLPAGAWMDRSRKRAVMIVADVARAALFATVPLAWWLGSLTIYQLYVVVFLAGVATVFFDVAAMSFMPELVGRDRLVQANGVLGGMTATGEVVGLSLGGVVIQLITAPIALLLDVVSYSWSALWLLRISQHGTVPKRKNDARLGGQIREGLQYVFRHPVLRTIAAEGACINLCTQMCLTLLPVVLIRELGVSAGTLGLYLALASVGVFVGSLTARRVGQRLGEGRALWIVGAATMPAAILIPMVSAGPMLWLTAFAWLVTMYRIGVNTVLKVSFRQRATPDGLLGRMNATFRCLLTGSLAAGAAFGGLVGELVSVRTVLWIGAVGTGLSWLIVFFSPIRAMRTLDSAQH